MIGVEAATEAVEVSNEIEIGMPGLTAAVAVELDRRADLLGAPFSFSPPRRPRWRAAEHEASVLMADLREEPNVASETHDHPEGWPESDEVRQWLARAARFLGDNAPQRRFTFRAGWGDHQRPMPDGEIDMGTFLGLIADGRLHADERYAVRSTESHPPACASVRECHMRELSPPTDAEGWCR